MCILLQSVSNEVFALLGILLTNMGIFCLNCSKLWHKIKSSFHNNNNNNNRKKLKKERELLLRALLRLFSFIYTQNLRQQTTDARIVHDL